MAEPRIDGCVQFHITVPPQDMQHWPAVAITQFFNGLAQAICAAGKNAEIQVVQVNDGDGDGQAKE